jgi:hypothetical protein
MATAKRTKDKGTILIYKIQDGKPYGSEILMIAEQIMSDPYA